MAETEESEKTFPRDGSGATWGSPAEAVQEWIRSVRNRFRNGRSDPDPEEWAIAQSTNRAFN